MSFFSRWSWKPFLSIKSIVGSCLGSRLFDEALGAEAVSLDWA